MYERIDETPCLALVAYINEELRPDARLNDVRHTNDEERDDGKFLDCCFHEFILDLQRFAIACDVSVARP